MKTYLLLPGMMIFFSACQTIPQQQFFIPPPNSTVITAEFKHLIINKAGNSNRLHVYIEGDGTPFSNRFQIAENPSPTNPMMLQLMTQDDATSLYLGRPCYFTYSLPTMFDNQCKPAFWTSARYSNQIVESMVTALHQYLSAHPAQGVTLIGHSGGGTIAMLMAARMREVDQVVTLAGNLDVSAWTSLHHYTPLRDSLNPATTLTDTQPSRQLHFGGDKDDNIPPSLSQTFLAQLQQPMTILLNTDHNCCWLEQWLQLLNQINQQIEP